MKLKEYLIDKLYLVLFYFLLMFFISVVVYLDGTIKVSAGNIIYINFVSFVLFIIYLFGGFIKRKRYYEQINDIIENHEEDIIDRLPQPTSNEHRLYHNLLTKIYNEQSKKIEQLYEDKKDNLEFITTWVHEVKTPIAVSRLVIQNSSGKNLEETLDSLEDEIDRIDNYVEQALYYCRTDSFSKDYLINEIELDKVIKEIVKKHAKIFISKRIRIEIDESNVSVTTDKKWLIFIIDQILSNSLKYTDENGKIKFSIEKDTKEKRLIIEDNGIGIKPEDIVRVFDKGFTGYNGRNNYKSTGMGLYLAQTLARKLGHNITITSSFGEYTKVIIHFPKLIDYFNVSK